jgi:regulator of protease activity HflC (stomatin/prohibitin superfamily)
MRNIILAVVVCVLVLGSGIGGCAAYNHYRVYSAQQAGKAVLAEAQSSRQVKTLEARAAKESASLLAEAEVARARGAAEANHILQNSLGGPEGYLRYLQIQSLENTEATLIYVPTEAGLPVTEAKRLGG